MSERKIKIVKEGSAKKIKAFPLAMVSMLIAPILPPVAWLFAQMSLRRASNAADRYLGVVARRIAIALLIFHAGVLIWGAFMLQPVFDQVMNGL